MTINNTVQLTWYEIAMASHVGWMRYISVLKNGRESRSGFAGGEWAEHINGACGEMAVAKFLGMFWNGSIDTWQSADLGNDIQVRMRTEDWHEMPVRDRDADDHRFVLITGKMPDYTVRGWLLGRDAKRDEWRKDPGGKKPSWFVPQSALRPMSELFLKDGAA